MSKYTQKELGGSIWRNKNPKSEKSPPYMGQCKIDFQDYIIFAWVNEFQGEKYFKLTFRLKEEQKPFETKKAYQGEEFP